MASAPASILTERLRKMILTGEESSNVHRDRKAIRDRVIAGMIDLRILSDRWPQKEMDKVFPPLYVDKIFEYYFDSETYSHEELEGYLGEDYTEEDRYLRHEPEYTQLKSSPHAYLYGLNWFLLRVLKASHTVSEIKEPRDLIAPELHEFERLVEGAIYTHLTQSNLYGCNVDVSIDISGCVEGNDRNP